MVTEVAIVLPLTLLYFVVWEVQTKRMDSAFTTAEDTWLAGGDTAVFVGSCWDQ